MAQLTVNKLAPGASIAQTLVAAAGGGDSFANSGKEQIAIKNAGGGSINLTIRASAGANNDKCNFGIAGTPGHDLVIAIPNDSAIYLLGPWNPRPFSDGSGLCQLVYSAVTSLTIGIFVAPPAV